MLDNYFGREPKSAFTVQLETEKMSDRYMKNMWTRAAAVCAGLAVITGAVFAAVQHNAATAEPEPPTENTLFLKAYAENVSEMELFETPDYVGTGTIPETELLDTRFLDQHFWENYYFGLSLPEEEAVRDGRAVEGCYYPTLPQSTIPLRIYGSNIVSVNIKSEKNIPVEYYDCSLSNTPEYRAAVEEYLHLSDAEKAIVKGFYLYGNAYLDCPGFVYGECSGDIPLNEYVTFCWTTPKFFLYGDEYKVVDYMPLGEEKIQTCQDGIKDFLTGLTAEEMSDIFGDTLYITAKYADGSEKEMQMRITIDSSHQFVVDYIY